MWESPLLEFNSSFKGAKFYTEKNSKSRPIPDWARRLQARLAELGWSVAELARRMGHGDDVNFLDKLYKYVQGSVKQPRGEMIEEIAAAVGMTAIELRYGLSAAKEPMSNIHRLQDAAAVRTLGEVAAGVFRDVTHADHASFDEVGSPLPPDTRYPAGAQYDLIVRGTSINKFAPDGHRLRVLDTGQTGRVAQDGEFVIVRRSRDGGQTVETTAKRYLQRGKTVELWPVSDDARWQTSLNFGDGGPDQESVEIVGIVLFTYQTAGSV